MAVQILLPDERANQLRTFASSKGVSLADAIALLINDAIAAGKIPNEVPGFTIERAGDAVLVDTGAWKRILPLDLAKTYADRIRAITRPILTPGKDNPFLPVLGLDVTRRGVGIKLVDTEGKFERTVAPSVAEDVARLIDQAAK